MLGDEERIHFWIYKDYNTINKWGQEMSGEIFEEFKEKKGVRMEEGAREWDL